ncbi:MAG: glycosyltransferase family 39 protein [Deltaproteobacteria bacterium]|nr:glycosyltransferase family 39 protein [Deltaproteobacteria bacterium]
MADHLKPVVLTLLAAPVLLLGLGTPAFMDHEGRYAEVAREMLLTGDWITPHLNFTVFLNKPPLPYWLTALTFELVGLNEYVRLWPAVVGLGTLVVTACLGQTLAGPRGGLRAGFVLLTSAGFFLESRILRPDLLLTLLLSMALLGFLKASAARADDVRTRWVCLCALSLALSMLTKGLVGVVLAGGTVGLVLLLCGRFSLLRQTRWWPALAIVLAVVFPWYLLAGLRNEGFWWDYVVNQHLLFFFDRKFPRDSLPDSLLVFWGAFLLRTFPWSVFLPVAILRTLTIIRSSRTPGTILPLAWLGIVLAFFSCSPSRLEHYSLPALPAVALLIGRWWAEVMERGVRAPGGLVSCAVLILVGVSGFLVVPGLVESESWAQGFPELTRPLPAVCGIIVLGAAVALQSLWHGRSQLAFVVLVITMTPQFFFIHQALTLIEPVNSWKAVGTHLAQLLPRDGEAVFAASEEYQICGGLNFYSGKPLTILLPDGYTPPTYLAFGHHTPFLTRAGFLYRWQGDRPILLVIDPDRGETDPAALAPPPMFVVGKWGERLLLANRAFAEAAGATHASPLPKCKVGTAHPTD